MRNNESLDNLYLCIIVVAIAIIDVQLSSFFSQNLNYQLSNVLFSDVLVVSLAGFLGKYLALKSGFPLWWRQGGSTLLSRGLAELFILGVMIILPNTLIYYHNDNISSAVSWLKFSNLKEPLLISLRAGLQEEVVYRLLILTLIAFIVRKFVHFQQASVAVAIIISAVLFGILHSGFYFAFISGLILGYIYYSFGLLPAILIHFLADAIPLTLLFMRQNI